MPGSRLRRPPTGLALGLAVLVGAAGSAGVLYSARERSEDVERVPDLEEVLAANDGPAENFLLVGSDSREGVDTGDPENASVGDEAEVSGQRSDTIMILRRDEDGGASLLSLPRDLWVPIAGTDHSAKINSAYNEGPQRLARTVTESLGIPVHHYVEVDFIGFTKMVDEIGGVEICVDYAAQDENTGLRLNPGCQVLNGEQALAYARSRH
jgi:LCP family protein required for cell wall assembly